MATISGTFANVTAETDVVLYPASAFTVAPSAGTVLPDQSLSASVQSSQNGAYTFNVPVGEYYAATTDNTGTTQFAHLYVGEEGLRLPTYATASLPAVGTGDAGMLVYDTTVNKAKLWVGNAWQVVTSA